MIGVYQLIGCCTKNVKFIQHTRLKPKRMLPKVDEISIVNEHKDMFPNIRIFGIFRWRNRVVIDLVSGEVLL